jgi:hypothetical protein
MYNGMNQCIWSIQYNSLGREVRGVKSVGYTFGLSLALLSLSKCKIIENVGRKYWIISSDIFSWSGRTVAVPSPRVSFVCTGVWLAYRV